MSISYGGDNIQDTDGGVLRPSSSVMRNRIINGSMTIDQRNAGASVTPNNSYTLDRWIVENSQASKLTVQQNAGSVTPPVGFSNYLGVTSTAATTVGSSDYFMLEQRIEGYNIADLNLGSANAKTITLSFWVRSSLTGTFGGTLMNGTNARAYPFTYTISSANTWEQKSVTIAGDTSGTWSTTNGTGILLSLGLGVGSTYSGTAGSWTNGNLFSATGATSVVGTNGATFYITGCQLEVGSSATGFEYRQYGQELALCQRYCNVLRVSSPSNPYSRFGVGVGQTTTTSHINYYYPVTMRTQPTITTSSASNFALYDGVTLTTCSQVAIDGDSSPHMLGVSAQTASGLTATRPYELVANNNYTALVTISAEL